MKQFSIDQLARNLPAISTINIDNKQLASRIVIDSRQIQQGDVFLAIKGEKDDGHKYLEQAIKAGAVAVVVDDCTFMRSGWPVILVDDTTLAMGRFAKYYRQQFETMTIGVTGSVGKTTTRNLIHAVLSQEYAGLKSQKNFNNQWGVPLTLFELDQQHEFAVLELGASKVGDISYLSDIVQPEIGVITAIGPAHLESFGGMSKVMETKCELFKSLPESGLAIYSEDDAFAKSIKQRIQSRSRTAGWSAGNDLVGEYQIEGAGVSKIIVDGVTYKLPFAGRHLAQLALFAVAIGLEIGLHVEDIANGLLSFEQEGHRQQIYQTNSGTLIDDCYNASPLSMKAACQLVQEWPSKGSKYLVLGSMLELGDASVALHQEIGKCVAQAKIQYLYAYGPFAHEIIAGAKRGGMSGGQLGLFENLEILGSLLICTLNPEDVVLVKGSRSMHMEQIIDILVGNHQVTPRQMMKRAA